MKLSPEAIAAITSGIGTGVEAVSNMNPSKWEYPSCGKRPFWTGKRRRAYDECIKTAQRVAPQGINPNLNPDGSEKTNYVPYIIAGGAIIATIGIYSAVKK